MSIWNLIGWPKFCILETICVHCLPLIELIFRCIKITTLTKWLILSFKSVKQDIHNIYDNRIILHGKGHTLYICLTVRVETETIFSSKAISIIQFSPVTYYVVTLWKSRGFSVFSLKYLECMGILSKPSLNWNTFFLFQEQTQLALTSRGRKGISSNSFYFPTYLHSTFHCVLSEYMGLFSLFAVRQIDLIQFPLCSVVIISHSTFRSFPKIINARARGGAVIPREFYFA